MSYPVGSQWNKWDLHVHTPMSIIQDFGGNSKESWDSYIAKLASLPPEIKVLGITDYLFVDGYEELLKRKSEFPNIELLLPNIEFRLNTFSGTENNKKRHNFHVIFSPQVTVEVIREQLLNALSTGYFITDKAEWNQTPTPRSLSILGQQMKAKAPADNSIHGKSDLVVGFENITYELKDILKRLKKDCFAGKYITAVGYTEWSQGRWDQSAAEKRNLISIADICLTANDDVGQINENIEDLIRTDLNHKVFHASDAHDIGRIGLTKTWIKADPTFAGFKQVLNEPDHRKFIGDLPPNHKYDHQVISKVGIKNSNGWFSDEFEQVLNSELISIIGPRGSGKSALAELIAFGAGTQSPVVEDSFIKKANQHPTSPIDSTEVSLTWKDGSVTKFKVGIDTADQDLVRYLSQGAVEKLCDPINTDELVEQIEDVVFQSLDETARRASPSFTELKTKILKRYEHQKNELDKKIRDTNKEIAEIEHFADELPNREQQKNEIDEQIIKLTETLPVLNEEDLKGQEELTRLKEYKFILENGIVERTNAVNDLDDFLVKASSIDEQVASFKSEADDLLIAVGSNSDGLKITLEYSSYTEKFAQIRATFIKDIKTLKEGARAEIAMILGKLETDIPGGNLKEVDEQINETIKKTKSYETAKKKYQEQKQLITNLQKKSDQLTKSIENIRKDSSTKLGELRLRRIELLCNFFTVLNQEIDEMETLYKPLQTAIGVGPSEVEALLKFSAKPNFKVSKHVGAGLNIIDRTKKGNFKAEGELESQLRKSWAEIIKNDFNQETIASMMASLEEKFKSHNGETISISSQLKGSYSSQDLYDWLFDVRPYEVTSSITFDDTDLHLLSPGQKGIVLLKLYLEIDKNDTRPLVIDQPEENLDNHSIVTELKEYRNFSGPTSPFSQ